MTEPSEAAKRKACELANAHETRKADYWSPEDCGTGFVALYALALRLDFEDRAAREVDQYLAINLGLAGDCYLRTKLRSLMLPDPVDPLEEAIKICWVADDILIAKFRAELAKRGYNLVKETPDD